MCLFSPLTNTTKKASTIQHYKFARVTSPLTLLDIHHDLNDRATQKHASLTQLRNSLKKEGLIFAYVPYSI